MRESGRAHVAALGVEPARRRPSPLDRVHAALFSECPVRPCSPCLSLNVPRVLSLDGAQHSAQLIHRVDALDKPVHRREEDRLRVRLRQDCIDSDLRVPIQGRFIDLCEAFCKTGVVPQVL